MMHTWTTSRFRSSPALDLKRFDELPPEQQNAFRELRRDEDFYGVLVPRVIGSANLKSVGSQTARLFRSLMTPSRIEPSLFEDETFREDIIDLVLDGILEIENGDGFCHGADAFPLLCHPERESRDLGGRGAMHRIGLLSREALQHAEDLAVRDAASMTSAIYAYNRMPRTRRWAARFPDRDAVLEHIGAEGGTTAVLLDRHWVCTPPDRANGWISWQARRSPTHPGPSTESALRAVEGLGMTWKLYVSPHPEHIADAFRALVRVLSELPGSQMKIGQDAAGLLRPDKLVAYFRTRDDLDAAASALAVELQGCPAHGVPFTAGFGEDGLLSWGIDPPDSERPLSWLDRESWRLWIAKTLASALALAKNAARPGVEPWRFAVERVRRYGVDVDHWTPADTLWRSNA